LLARYLAPSQNL